MPERDDKPEVLVALERLNAARASGENPVVLAELERLLDAADARRGYERGMSRVERHQYPATRPQRLERTRQEDDT